ncbi:flagellar hook-length control protein FliK, partial [Bordetella bronchiseptica]
MTTATLPIPALTPAPGPAAQGGPAAAGKGPSFSQVLARQQGGKPGEAGTPAAPGAQAGVGRGRPPHHQNVDPTPPHHTPPHPGGVD